MLKAQTTLIQHSVIRKIITVLLLVVFSISNSPREFFHQAFANHTDWDAYCSDDLKSPHFHQSGMDCHFDDLVVSSLYDFTFDLFPEAIASFYIIPHPHFEVSSLLQTFPLKESRGPPAT